MAKLIYKATGRTTDVRKTKNYLLYRGYGPTENVYWIMRYSPLAISARLSVAEAQRLTSNTDDDEFDIMCSKFDYS